MADLRTSYQRVIVELEQLLPLEFDVLCKEGISESLESLLEEVYSKLYDASNSGSLDQFFEVVLATMDSSLKVLHDYIEKAVMSKVYIATILYIGNFFLPNFSLCFIIAIG